MGVDRSEDVASATARNPVVVTVRGGLDHDTHAHWKRELISKLKILKKKLKKDLTIFHPQI